MSSCQSLAYAYLLILRPVLFLPCLVPPEHQVLNDLSPSDHMAHLPLILDLIKYDWASLMAQMVKNVPAMQETQF